MQTLFNLFFPTFKQDPLDRELGKLFQQQMILIKQLKELIKQPNSNSQHWAGMFSFGGALALWSAFLYALAPAREPQTQHEFLKYDFNFAQQNPPELDPLSIIFWTIAIALFLILLAVFSYCFLEAPYPEFPTQADRLIKKLNDRFYDLDTKTQEELKDTHQRFLCSLFHALMRNPLEVWTSRVTINGEEKRQVTLYDFNAFYDYIAHLKKSPAWNPNIIPDPRTRLPIIAINFSSERNRELKAYLTQLNIRVTAMKQNSSLKL